MLREVVTMTKQTIKMERFTNYRELLTTCDNRDYNSWAQDCRDESACWAGDGYTDARRMLEHGDASLVGKLTPHTVTQAQSIRPEKRADVCGYAPIVPAAIIGLPKTMKRRVKRPAASKVLTLVVDLTGNCDVEAREFQEAGRELCAFIQGAEMAGYRIGVDVLAEFQRDGKGYAVRVCIKRPEQPLDIKRVAYPIAHASMFRQILFDWYERLPHAEHLSGYGHGIRYENAATRENVLAQILGPHEHYCSLLDRDFQSALK